MKWDASAYHFNSYAIGNSVKTDVACSNYWLYDLFVWARLNSEIIYISIVINLAMYDKKELRDGGLSERERWFKFI